LFEQLQANLSDEYYVFHSLRFCYEGKEHEADFVIMHPEKGIMCIECKSSYGGCSNGMCYYGNGEYMSDPYSQAADNSIFLRHLVLERLNADQTHIFDCVKKPHEFPCVFCWAVWFGIDKQSFINAKRNFPLLGNDNNTIFRDETMDPEKAQDRIEKVFAFASEAFKFRSNFKNILMPLVNRIMAPVFDIAPLPPTERSAFRFSRLLQEQMRVLDFLEEQNLTYRTVGEGAVVMDQIPVAGSTVPGHAEVVLYFNNSAPTELVTVPDFSTYNLYNANYLANINHLYILVAGANKQDPSVVATYQDIPAGTQVPYGTTVRVEFTDYSSGE
jgi:hypothetical protein